MRFLIVYKHFNICLQFAVGRDKLNALFTHFEREKIMICKFCKTEVNEEADICPFCGKFLEEETVDAQEAPAEVEVVEIVQDSENEDFQEVDIEEEEMDDEDFDDDEDFEDDEDSEDEDEEEKAQPKKKLWPLILGIIGAVAALGVLTIVLLVALGVDLKPRANDIQYKQNYTVSDEVAGRKADVVVATIGNKKLTNGQLQVYYNMQVADFINYYGSYMTYIGLDPSKPFGEQKCALDESLTWEQYFINIAIQTWHNYQSMGLLAEEAGFTLDADTEAQIAGLPESLNQQAVQGGYANADEMIQEFLGKACTLEDYIDYIRLIYLSNQFYNSEYERLTPTMEDIEKYFAENEATLAQSGITKESGQVSDVRHILVLFEGGTTDDEGKTTYSDEEKATALAEAERILEEWKAGAATEDSFAELANKYSGDPGSNTTGGLYQGIAPGSAYYENFLNWSIDVSRKTGDTGIVESQSGYHIMYFVTGEHYWITSVRSTLTTERTNALLENAQQQWPVKVNYKKIALTKLNIS